MNLSILWAAFWLNSIAAILVARLADYAFTRAGRMWCGGISIACALFAVFLLLKAAEWTLSSL